MLHWKVLPLVWYLLVSFLQIVIATDYLHMLLIFMLQIFSKEYVNLLLSSYFLVLGILALAHMVGYVIPLFDSFVYFIQVSFIPCVLLFVA